MMVDEIVALLDVLDSRELDQMAPARRQKFAELCYHWCKLAERRQERPINTRPAGSKAGEEATP